MDALLVCAGEYLSHIHQAERRFPYAALRGQRAGNVLYSAFHGHHAVFRR